MDHCYEIWYIKSLLIGAVTAALTNVLFAFLAIVEKNLIYLATIIIADNLARVLQGQHLSFIYHL